VFGAVWTEYTVTHGFSGFSARQTQHGPMHAPSTDYGPSVSRAEWFAEVSIAFHIHACYTKTEKRTSTHSFQDRLHPQLHCLVLRAVLRAAPLHGLRGVWRGGHSRRAQGCARRPPPGGVEALARPTRTNSALRCRTIACCRDLGAGRRPPHA